MVDVIKTANVLASHYVELSAAYLAQDRPLIGMLMNVLITLFETMSIENHLFSEIRVLCARGHNASQLPPSVSNDILRGILTDPIWEDFHAIFQPHLQCAFLPCTQESLKLRDEPTTPPQAKRQCLSNPEVRCIICMSNRPDYLFQPCGHLTVCGECKAHHERVSNVCPSCRQVYSNLQRVYYQ